MLRWKFEPDLAANARIFTCQDHLRVDTYITQALRAGADEYVMKPFDGDIIESKFAETGLV